VEKDVREYFTAMTEQTDTPVVVAIHLVFLFKDWHNYSQLPLSGTCSLSHSLVHKLWTTAKPFFDAAACISSALIPSGSTAFLLLNLGLHS